MKSRLLLLAQNPLFTGSTIMILGGGVGNIAAYLYHVIFGRLAGPAQYGELMAILSFIGIFLALFSSLGTVIMKFVPGQNTKEVAKVYYWMSKDLTMLAVCLGILLLLLSPLVASFLRIDVFTTLLIAPIVVFSILVFAYSSFLQGLLKFKDSVLVNNLSIILRLLLGLMLFAVGLGVFGIVAGLLLSVVLSLLLARHYLNKLSLPKVNIYPNRRTMLGYSIPVFVAALSLGSLFTADVLLVKYFFSAHDAGIYGATTVLGKIVFYIASPVAGVMFPLSVGKRIKGEKTLSTFLASIGFVGILSLAVLLLFATIPGFVVNTIFGIEYNMAGEYLFAFGVFSAMYTAVTFTSSYLLSLGYTAASYFLAVAAIFQIVGIYIFHSTLLEVVVVSTFTTFLLLVSMALYGGIQYHLNK